jgi:hypothetical protein
MGAKYLPTVRDQKAAQRFHLKQSGLKKLKTGAIRSVTPPSRRK